MFQKRKKTQVNKQTNKYKNINTLVVYIYIFYINHNHSQQSVIYLLSNTKILI